MDAMNPDELEQKVEKARQILHDSGAHFVIDTIGDLPKIIEIINDRLSMGLSPWKYYWKIINSNYTFGVYHKLFV